MEKESAWDCAHRTPSGWGRCEVNRSKLWKHGCNREGKRGPLQDEEYYCQDG
ncbi:hypothetical protein [Alteromonas ponticola]|uniref:Uncharacterized protein n=1 Tax=Alteromonas ponticola TaxID=2720613 RepID=A0ABX1R0X1_9ALTE|nr:hypothetical protein [Alteromonas ponticola]NMH59724.1 hypothetical protein [Alteromonas ponticola]